MMSRRNAVPVDLLITPADVRRIQAELSVRLGERVTRERLAELTGVSALTVIDWLNGERRPSRQACGALIDACRRHGYMLHFSDFGRQPRRAARESTSSSA